MDNKRTLEFLANKAELILKQEGTYKREVFVQLYPLLQFMERIWDVTSGLSKLFVQNNQPHNCWPFLVRPLMLDGVYISYAISKLVNNQDHNEIFYGMLSDGLAKIEKHAKDQKDWGVITPEESEEMIKVFKNKFKQFFTTSGDLVHGKSLIKPIDLIIELYKNQSFFFNPAQNFYTKYIVLSKYEHFNVLSTEVRSKVDITDYVKLMYVHFMFIVDVIISVNGAITSREQRKEFAEFGARIAPEYIN